MKIKPDHIQAIKDKIDAFITKHGSEYLISMYESGNFPRSDKVKDLQTRFNFDIFHHSGGLSAACAANVYEYANDEHIATALKKICPKVQRKY